MCECRCFSSIIVLEDDADKCYKINATIWTCVQLVLYFKETAVL